MISDLNSTIKTKEPSAATVLCILLLTLTISAILLFARLGHYSLWDDEALDALSAKGIMQTGDTTAVIGANIVAYRNGLVLKNLRNEGIPPLAAYASALSMTMFGESAFAARLPMAILGLGSIMLMLFWLWRIKPPVTTAFIFSAALLGNVSLFLYSRQCHYYALGIFLFVFIAYIYLNSNHKKQIWAILGLSLALLMAANPSWYVVISLCLLVDYWLFQRKVLPIRFTGFVNYILPQLVMGAILFYWWNPLQTAIGSYLFNNSIAQRLTLFLWNLRDLNTCEMIAGFILMASPFVAFIFKDMWLKRSLLVLFIYILSLSFISTQKVSLRTLD